ncbi:hypothetical protein [Sodalis praecaptivus]|uniref:hypothetical protein n=1 Tax=Sodalis praecaptivus TaxID=1239307 RepID=UPI0031F98385
MSDNYSSLGIDRDYYLHSYLTIISRATLYRHGKDAKNEIETIIIHPFPTAACKPSPAALF